jgi:RNA polymerase sigma-70 factor (ECF subfamily)
LQDADAADLTQEVLRGVAAGVSRLDYDRRRGSFSGWLFTLAHHNLHDMLGRRGRQPQGSGDSAVQEQLDAAPGRENDETVWRREYEQRLFDWAAEQARSAFQEATWRAFWMTAVEGRSGQEAASELGLTVAAVYLAKGRVVARLKELIAQVEGG